LGGYRCNLMAGSTWDGNVSQNEINLAPVHAEKVGRNRSITWPAGKF
jgi:hypothetical protein